MEFPIKKVFDNFNDTKSLHSETVLKIVPNDHKT